MMADVQRLILIGIAAIVLMTAGALVLVHRWTDYEGPGKGLGPGASRAFSGAAPGDQAPSAAPNLPADRAPVAPPPEPSASPFPAQQGPQADAAPPEPAPEPEPAREPRQRRSRRPVGGTPPGE
jgi:hypothetical protein